MYVCMYKVYPLNLKYRLLLCVPAGLRVQAATRHFDMIFGRFFRIIGRKKTFFFHCRAGEEKLFRYTVYTWRTRYNRKTFGSLLKQASRILS